MSPTSFIYRTDAICIWDGRNLYIGRMLRGRVASLLDSGYLLDTHSHSIDRTRLDTKQLEPDVIQQGHHYQKIQVCHVCVSLFAVCHFVVCYDSDTRLRKTHGKFMLCHVPFFGTPQTHALPYAFS